jgi:hypothetical protein
MHSRHTHRVWTALLALAAPLLLAALLVPAALARDNGDARAKLGLVNPTLLQLVGKRTSSGGCAFTSTLELAPGEDVIQEDTVAVDEKGCTALVVRGKPIADKPEKADRKKSGGAKADEATAERASAGERGLAVSLATHSKGYYQSWFEDPPGIDVNSVRNDVDWYWNGSYVYNGYCSYSYGWFSASGWGLKENDFFCRYENSQTQLRSSSYVHFKNGIFCAFIDTHTYYERNNAYGKFNGYLSGQVNWRKTGGCTGLLSFHTQLRRTLN